MSAIIDTSDMNNIEQMDLSPTPIQQFFSGSNIFITGGTGFLGKILINKLLMSCPKINKIYLLVRKKKGKDEQARIDDIFNEPIFNITQYRHKIHGITGDCIMSGLGLSISDKNLLVENVNIVFHMAATVRFDEKLKVALQINVQACKDILQICREMKQLKSYIHVSTAYTQCPLKRIEERFYAPPIDSGKLIVLSECLTDKLLESITPILLDEWPNTYAFTKAIAEDVVNQHGRGMPVGMFRPGIVISTYKEPVAGWIDNFYGPAGVASGAGTGVLRTLHCNPDAKANMVPVDFCVNGIISAAWDVSQQFSSMSSVDFEIPVFNFCTAPGNPITWGYFCAKTEQYGMPYPTMKAVWYFCYKNNPNKLVHMLYILFLHYLPAVLVDAFRLATGKKPKLVNIYKKIHRFMTVIEYFSMREWDYQLDTINGLWTKLSQRDKEMFCFDMFKVDWDLYLQQYVYGLRVYLVKDPIETLPKAMVRWKRFYWMHQFVKTIVILILLRFVWWICSLFL